MRAKGFNLKIQAKGFNLKAPAKGFYLKSPAKGFYLKSPAKGFNLKIQAKGFTLVELILVIAIMAIVAVIGSSLLTQSMQSYQLSQHQHRLMQRGRLVMEQMTRELRMALPASIRTSASGNCIEFMPILASTQTRVTVADQANNKTTSSTVSTTQFTLTATGRHATVGAMAATEIYSTANPGTRATLSSMAAGTYTQVTLSAAHRFLRNSKLRRLHITGDPIRFCLSASQIWRYSGYGLSTSSLTDTAPAGTSALMAQGVSTPSTAFSLSPGSEQRNTAAIINLSFSQDTLTLPLTTEVFIRNVP